MKTHRRNKEKVTSKQFKAKDGISDSFPLSDIYEASGLLKI